MQPLGHTNYNQYELAHLLAHEWYVQKLYVPGLPTYQYPADFWWAMAHRYYGCYCGQCHGKIGAFSSLRSVALATLALDRMAVIAYCEPCWAQVNARHHISSLMAIATMPPLGALLSLCPIAVRIVAYIWAESNDDEEYCQTCDIWLNGPWQLIEHIKGRKHKKKVRALDRGLTRINASLK